LLVIISIYPVVFIASAELENYMRNQFQKQ
jgi:hypothetical protein